MSLLMEALKKAEEAKRLAAEQVPGATSTAAPELTLAPMTELTSTPENSANSPLPDLSMHFASVDADLANVPTETPARQTAASASASASSDAKRGEATHRAAAGNVFAAKRPAKPLATLWLAIGLCALAALATGGYFWWQLRTVSSSTLARPSQSLPPVQFMPPVASQQTPPAALTEPAKPLPVVLPPSEPPASRAAPEIEQPPIARPTRTHRPSPAASRAAATDDPIRFSSQAPKSNLILGRAYNDYQAGNLDESKRNYEQALRGDPKNTDALLGLATIAARQGQAERAQDFYLRALESDPNDATAQAGLINARGLANGELAESRLKTALSNQPDSTALLFALGNLYSRQARWSEAQQAYFRAYSTDPDNADVIFNLAVSLDHLHQSKLAAQYYQRAVNTAEAANSRSVSFDRNRVKGRILELQP